MEKILSLAKQAAEAAEVFTVASEETSVQFDANRLKHVEGKQSTTTYLRVIKNGRIGFAITSGDVKEEELVAMAVETAEFGMEAKFEFPGVIKYPVVKTYDSSINAVTSAQMVKLGEELIAPLRENTPEIVCQAGVGRDIIIVKIKNSSGASAEYSKSIFSFGAEGTLVNGTDMLFVGESDASCHPILDTKIVTGLILRQLEYSKTQAKVQTGQMPVIFTPNGVAGAFMASLMSAFNGKTVLEGASPLGKKLGEVVFDTKLSMWDDTTIAFQPGSRPFDDEGVPSQRIPLIEKGKVTNFLYDLQTAGLAGKKSTGSAGRGRGLPSPSPGALVISSGEMSFDDMVKDIKEGLIVEQLMGAEQGNILGGDFSGNVLLGYKIENGTIAGRVKDTMVSGNIYRLLKEIVALGSETRWVGGFLQTPHIYCSNLSVASK